MTRYSLLYIPLFQQSSLSRSAIHPAPTSAPSQFGGLFYGIHSGHRFANRSRQAI